jgi:hypothetical protein
MAFNPNDASDMRQALEAAQNSAFSSNHQSSMSTDIADTKLVTVADADNWYNGFGLQDGVSDNDVASLQMIHNNMMRIMTMASYELGEMFTQARELFNRIGKPELFSEWVSATGYSMRTVYSLTSVYKAQQSLSGSQRQIFDELPTRLQSRIASQLKKSEDERKLDEVAALEKVFSGDITTLPEFQEAVAAYRKEHEEALEQVELLQSDLDDKDYQIAQAKDQASEWQSKYKASNSELKSALENPTVMTQYPDDYAALKTEHDAAIHQAEKMRQELEVVRDAVSDRENEVKNLEVQLNAMKQDSSEYAKVQQKMTQAKAAVEQAQARLENMNQTHAYMMQANEMLDQNLAPMMFSADLSDATTSTAMRALVERIDNWSATMRQRLNDLPVVVDATFSDK